ncbi:hypothetical protein [Sporosarcina sp. A2]|uniref:hypothetical protein n=1 Tax=Sporosarcina sp. A2 TaxID=3393449 RepID=UPI003D7A5A52
MTKSYRWEIIPMEEIDPLYVFTATDSALSAAQAFEEQYGNHISVYAIRKDAEITKFEEAI